LFWKKKGDGDLRKKLLLKQTSARGERDARIPQKGTHTITGKSKGKKGGEKNPETKK